MQDLKVAIIQSNLSWESADENLKRFDNWLAALNEPVDLIIFPEMFNTAFSMNPALCAEKPDGKSMVWLKKKAAEMNCVIAGSMLSNDKGKYYNRFVWMMPDGTYQFYDKRHLFRFAGEHEVFSAGNKKITTHICGWKIRPLVCYDLRFPVWSKNTFANNSFEFDCIVYVANWPEKRRNAWMSLLVARAIENQSYVIGVNRIGNDGKGNPHSGDSMIVDPKGNIIVQLPDNKEAMQTAVLSYSELRSYREHFKVALDWDNFTLDIQP